MHTFENVGRRHKRCHVSGRKVVITCRYRLGIDAYRQSATETDETCTLDGNTLNRFGQEVNMQILIIRDFPQIRIECRVCKTRIGKVLLGEVRQALPVEGRFEVFQRQGVVENVH